MEDEKIVLLDDKFQPIGTAPKLASHNAHTPLHLAFSCYVFNKDKKFLVTQRALSKKTFPGVFTNSCCGHPAPNEPIESAVKRRLKHELGLTASHLEVLLPDYRYTAEMNGIVENEFCPVYYASVDAEPEPRPDEVESYEWLAWDEFKRRLKERAELFSPWCREQAKLIEPHLKKLGII